MIIIGNIILATGSEELNNAVIEYSIHQNSNYSFKQVYYREFLLEDNDKYNTCIISELLPGEIDFDKLIYTIRSKDIRVILILLKESKEELEICIKYHITDVLTQPVKPIDIINIIQIPKTFKDIEFIYKKVGFNLEFNLHEFNNKKSDIKESKKITISEKQTKEIVKHTYSVIGSKNIGVVGLSHGAGATFFTLNFAKAISEFSNVAVIEYPLLVKPKIYNTIGIANLIENADDFISIAHNIKNNNSTEISKFVKDNISFIVTDPNKDDILGWDENMMLRLLYVSKSPINIVDLGTNLFDDSIFNIIEQFSCILLIIDPYIPNVLENISMLEKIKKLEKENRLNIKIIINKFNDGVDKTELLNNLDIYPISYIPFIEPQHIYEAAHKNKIPYGIKDVKEILSKEFEKLAKDINLFPKEIPGFKNKKSFLSFLR